MENVPKIVQARLQRERVESHPDADLLTAFAEQSLGKSERENLIEHLARCSDCREVVSLALPGSEAATASSSSRAPGAAWFRWPAVRWAVVAAGIGLVTSVGILQYKERVHQNAALVANGNAARQEERLVTQPGQTSVPSAPTTVPQTFEITKQAPMRNLPRSQAGVAAHQPAPSPNAVFPATRTMSGGRSQSPPAEPMPQTAVSGASQMVEARSGSAELATQNQTQAQLAQNPMDLPAQKQPLNNLDVVKAKDSEPPQAQSTVVFAPTVSTPNISLQKQVSSSPRWSISPAGALQKSFDAGATWEDVNVGQMPRAGAAKMDSADQTETYEAKKLRKKDQSNTLVVFRAVAALGPEVWAGGSGAMLYHSPDSGSHWTRVLPSEANLSLTGDIVEVEFFDTEHGKIATSAGEVWTTADDGHSWHRQQ